MPDFDRLYTRKALFMEAYTVYNKIKLNKVSF